MFSKLWQLLPWKCQWLMFHLCSPLLLSVLGYGPCLKSHIWLGNLAVLVTKVDHGFPRGHTHLVVVLGTSCLSCSPGDSRFSCTKSWSLDVAHIFMALAPFLVVLAGGCILWCGTHTHLVVTTLLQVLGEVPKSGATRTVFNACQLLQGWNSGPCACEASTFATKLSPDPVSGTFK